MRRRTWALAATVLLAGCGGDDEPERRVTPAGPELIAFSSKRDGDFDVFVMRPDGTGVRQLTRNDAAGTNEADDTSPVWSPDGARIAFLSTRDHRGDSDEARDLYVMDADGTAVRRLTDNNAADYPPAWSPDGERIAFVRTLPRGGAIFEIGADGSGERRVTEPRFGLDVGIDWSPDGKRLLVTRIDTAASRPTSDVYAVDPEDGSETRLTDAPGADGVGAWSPDGEKIAFGSDRDRNGRCFFHDCTGFAPEIYVMNADGSDQRRLTQTPAYELFPDWSPDGSRIVFARLTDDESDYELFVVNADGTCERQLTDNDVWDWMPSWTGAGEGPLEC